MHYFDIQFRLLREDFISPLREGINDYLNGKVGRDLRNVKVYHGVTIVRPVFTKAGLCHQIKFNVQPFGRYRWDYSQRLIFGSLLCLSPDQFHSKVFFATVSNRDPEKLPEGLLDVKFEVAAEMLTFMKMKTEFVMVESLAYFEASRHILRSLQEAEGIETFTKYMISNDCSAVKHPQYLKSGEEKTTYDMKFILKPKYQKSNDFAEVPIEVDSKWPSVDMTNLDESQLEAIKMALTQEVAVIQGPPGTGKTYIGLKIVQALLRNRRVWKTPLPLHDFFGNRLFRQLSKSPILVMCYTNHALDQFLEGILQMNSSIKMIRIGGRSKNERIQECSLSAVKKNLRNVPSHEFRHMRELSEKADMEGNSCKSQMDKYNKFILFPALKSVMKDQHYWSMIEPAETQEEEKRALELWLGLCEKKEKVEYETVTLPQQDSVLTSDEEESDSEYDSSADDSASSKDSETANDETVNAANVGVIATEGTEPVKDDTIDVAGNVKIEEDARMVDEVKDMYKEIKFSSTKGGRGITQTPQEKTVQVEIRRTVIVVESHGHYHLKRLILNGPEMCQDEANNVHNVNSLSLQERYRLYKYWHTKYREYLINRLEEKCRKFDAACDEANEAQKSNDRYALDTADVIGMTTTGAAKYQHVLEIVKPKIVIVEEAAEVLESHIVSALNTGTHHLILIEDHKQLRPSPNDYELAIKYKLEISLFERLVINKFPHVTLQIQHRMRPQIADLVRGHIYDTLYDHKSVQVYPSIKGVAKNLFFIQHCKPESPSDLSHSNQHEAKYLAALCKFLLQQGYEPSQITILVTYTGQLLLIKKFMPRNVFDGVRVATVDNFQGEENDIILLSLVRSNDRNSIGFLKASNRVCVALSRAKHGFYCIGNFEMLRSQAKIWEDIVKDMVEKDSIGEKLNVHCNNHPNCKFAIKNPEEFEMYIPTGGCERPCEHRLRGCGHVCERKCHSDDPSHEKCKCKKPCCESCKSCGQPCMLLCFQECVCFAKVLKAMPDCGHLQEMYCHQDPSTAERCQVKCTEVMPYCGHEQEVFCYQDLRDVRCKSKCENKCSSGHSCPLYCYQGCSLCQVRVTVKMPQCGHLQEKYCFEDLKAVLCQSKCEKKCSAGHACPLKCHEDCGRCYSEVATTLLCGHEVQLRCFQTSTYKCKERVTKTFPCGHTATVKCFKAPSAECDVEVSVTLPCAHTMTVQCSKKATAKCTKPCEKILSCKHKCTLQCGDHCDSQPCQQLVQVRLLTCRHKAMVPCYRRTSYSHLKSIMCDKPCEKKLPCQHKCTNVCGKPCIQDCQVEGIIYTCTQGHRLIRRCSETLDRLPCPEKCTKKLKCGHPCQNLCHEQCTTKCDADTIKTYPCGHKHKLACSTPIEEKPCDIYCREPLACGHLCRGKCSDCWSTRIHKPCDYRITQAHYTGEMVEMRCVGLTNCRVSTGLRVDCMHDFSSDCTTENFKCSRACDWACCHHHCSMLCHEPCNRPPCNKRCPEELACGHLCIGLCGEPCISTCPLCDAGTFKRLLQSPGGYLSKHSYIQLPCEHIYMVSEMDELTDKQLDSITGPLRCPKCYVPFSCSFRYGNKMKEALFHMNEVKTQEKELRNTQKNLTVEKREKLKSAIIPLVKTQLLSGTPIAFSSQFLVKAVSKLKMSGWPVSSSEGFLLYLLAKVVLFASSNITSVSLYQTMIESLVRLMNEPTRQLSFQIIHDLASEFYRLCAITKLQLSRQGFPVMNEPIFLRCEHPHSRMSKGDFLFHSKSLDSKVSVALSIESCEKFVRDMNYFFPVILSGCWKKCGCNHYYCIPVSEPGTLSVQCPECTGNYLDSIIVKQRSIVEVDVTKQTLQVLATIKSEGKTEEHHHEDGAAQKKKKKKKRIKKRRKQ